MTLVSETSHKQRFIMGNLQTANCHVTTGLRSHLQFTFEPLEGLLAVSDLRQRFLPLKIVQPRFKRHELAFYIRLRCVCWSFDLESLNYCCFLGD